MVFPYEGFKFWNIIAEYRNFVKKTKTFQYSEITIYTSPIRLPDLDKYTDLLKCPSCGQSVCILHFNRLTYVFNAYI